MSPCSFCKIIPILSYTSAKTGNSFPVYIKKSASDLFCSFKCCCSGNFCNLYASRKILLTLFLSIAFLKLRLLVVTPACSGTEVSSSTKLYNTLTGKAEILLPLLNKYSISLRLLTFSSLLYVNRPGIERFLQK